MNSKELKAKFIEKGLSDDAAAELSDYVMKNNGIDINRAKENSADELASIKAELETLKGQNTTLSDQLKGYADYAELKKFKDDVLIKEENGHKLDFLKAAGLKDEKYADLLLGQLDFTKGVYDSEKKTYTGLDDSLKGLKDKFGEMFNAPEKAQVVKPNSSQSSDGEKYGWEKVLDSRWNG